VSGCACAVSLAGLGMKVTVVSSALDCIGLPGYGPNVIAGGNRAAITEALATIPLPLREIWLTAAVTPDCESGFFAVDRRMVSIETKRALEQIPLLGFRQGVVTDLRIADNNGGSKGGPGAAGARVIVETAFGEVMEADAVVVAVGLGLGGTVHVGEDVLSGGRYGETGADGLRKALERMGASFEEARLEVGPRLGGKRPTAASQWGAGRDVDSGSDPVGGVSSARARPLREALGATAFPDRVASVEWPAAYPAAPHWMDELWAESMVFVSPGQVLPGPGECVPGPGEGKPTPVISPDGVATGELYVDPLAARDHTAAEMLSSYESGGGGGLIASRLGHCVIGKRITNVSSHGRLVPPTATGPSVWIVGRAGGAGDYLESLRSGVRAARDVRAWLEGAR